jgi:hypothetical protein
MNTDSLVILWFVFFVPFPFPFCTVNIWPVDLLTHNYLEGQGQLPASNVQYLHALVQSSRSLIIIDSSITLSEFAKPFTSPANWFQDVKRRKRFVDADMIAVDYDGTTSRNEMIKPEPSPDVNTRHKVLFIWLLTFL